MVDRNDERQENVRVELTRAQALVLFEFLSRETDSGALELHLADQAEMNALWGLEGRLEAQLHELLSPDYKELLAQAKDRLREFPQG